MKSCNLSCSKSISWSALLIGASVMSVTSAQAQESTQNSQSVPIQTSGQLSEIVVTAERRKASAQSVPISLQTFSAKDLQESGVHNTEDLQAVVGGLIIDPTGARPDIFIRGVGNNTSNTTPEVATYVDGVYQPFGRSIQLANIANVTVLKGPQGTLFGRNATAGVIQIKTVPPSETPSAHVEVGYGSYQTFNGNAYVTGGLARHVAMDLSISDTHQGEGFGTNVFNGQKVFYTDQSSARTRLRWEVSSASTLTLEADYSQIRGTTGANVSPTFGFNSLFVNGAIRTLGTPFYPGDFAINTNLQPYYTARENGESLTFESHFDGMIFKDITAYRRGGEHFVIDFDGGPANLINLNNERSPQTAFTEELQLLSDTDGPFQWVGGVFYYDQHNTLAPFSINTTSAYSKSRDESIAPYGQVDYKILPNTKLTLGARYTDETVHITGNVFSNGAAIPGRSGTLSQTSRQPTWRVALDHNFSSNVLVYASVSRGYNTGFFNQINLGGFANETQNPAVKPETLTDYEVGTKTDLFDHHLRVNLSGFLYHYNNLQQQIYDVGVVKTINAASARIKGVDFEIDARPLPSLTLSLSGTYLDAVYESYPAAPNYVLEPNYSVIASGQVDAAGRNLVNAPKITYTLLISHVLLTPVGDFTTSSNLNYRGKTFQDPENRFPLPTRYLWDATERWTSAGGRYFASLWVKNLLDKRWDYATSILVPVGLVGEVAPPRTYGVSFGVDF